MGCPVDRSNALYLLNIVLTQLFPMHPFSTPWKHQKILRQVLATNSPNESVIAYKKICSLVKITTAFLQLCSKRALLRLSSWHPFDVVIAVSPRVFHLNSLWHCQVHRNTDLFSLYFNFAFRKIHPGSILLRTYDDEGNPIHDHVRNFENNKAKYQTLRFLLRCWFIYSFLNVVIASKCNS